MVYADVKQREKKTKKLWILNGCDLNSCVHSTSVISKLHVLVYDILLSTTAVYSYAKGSRKLSANEQFFVRAQTVVSLLQPTQVNQTFVL